MANAAVSVILPVYNIEKYLPACMESLFAQTYSDFEIILVDDGSCDVCSRLCDSYTKYPNVAVYHKKNGGLSHARNYGLDQASGEWIVFIDPDDTVDPDHIAYLKGLVDRYGTSMGISQHRVIFPDGRVKDFGSEGEELSDDRTCIERMLYSDVIDTSAWAKIYRKELFAQVRYPVGLCFEDIATTYALMMAAGKIAVGYRSTYNYIYRPDSIVNRTFNPHKLDLLKTTDRMARDVTAVYPDLRDAVIRRRVYSRFSTLNQMLEVDGYEDERREIIAFIKKYQKNVLKNPKAPRRDKSAIMILNMDYRLYRSIWMNRNRLLHLNKEQESSDANGQDLKKKVRLRMKKQNEGCYRDDEVPEGRVRLDLDGIKAVEKGLLREFVRICEKNGFYYTLCGGTLLGCIRHKGFIPWDDDIDVFLTRPDYDKLLCGEADLSILPDHIKVVCWKDGSMNFPFIKLVDTRTEVKVDYFDERYNVNHIWIDVFPIDGNTDNRTECVANCRKIHLLRHILTLKMSKSGEGKSPLKAALKPAAKVFLRPISMQYLCRRIDELSKLYPFNGGRTAIGYLWGYGPQEAIDREKFMVPLLREFEGDMYQVPSNYDEYLTNLYGDYMQLPPVEQRVIHGLTAYIKK